MGTVGICTQLKLATLVALSFFTPTTTTFLAFPKQEGGHTQTKKGKRKKEGKHNKQRGARRMNAMARCMRLVSGRFTGQGMGFPLGRRRLHVGKPNLVDMDPNILAGGTGMTARISRFGAQGFTISGVHHQGAVIVLPNMHLGWKVQQKKKKERKNHQRKREKERKTKEGKRRKTGEEGSWKTFSLSLIDVSKSLQLPLILATFFVHCFGWT